MSLIEVLVNIGYLFMLVGLTVRDILWLRVILISAQICFLGYGLNSANHSVVFWNSLFLLINSYQVVRLVRERRPIDLEPDLLDLYNKVFRQMRRREFLFLWHMGQVQSSPAETVIVHQNQRPDHLFLLLEGDVRVVKFQETVASLSRGSFVAEMSFLTGNPATADVITTTPVRYLAWSQSKLRDLQKMNPDLLIKFQNILGIDLTEKIHAGSRESVS